MPTDVQVHISDATVISALNTPGGAVYQWRNEIEDSILRRAYATSPVNNVLNAMHRGGVVGVFQASWVSTHVGSNGHRVRVTVENFADHAVYVEEGRSGSNKYQRFSWTKWNGTIRSVGGRENPAGSGTRPRPGRHILKYAVNAALVAQGLAPIV